MLHHRSVIICKFGATPGRPRDELGLWSSHIYARCIPQPVPGSADPLMPFTSRFPLSPSGSRLTSSLALPSGPATRPFGLRYAVRPVACGKHSKQPTQKTRTGETQITDDGKVTGVKPDTVHYVEMDEE
jgi:hypothetical protein